MALKLNNLRAGYGSGTIIDIEGYAFEGGRITSIIGKNGSGKSTLLKAIDAQLPYAGSVTVDGAEVSEMPHAQRAKMVAYLPQQLSPVAMSVRTLVSHGRFPYKSFGHNLTGEDDRIIDEAMKMVEVAGLGHRQVSSLSGGEMSRAYIAMVIAQKSRYILLDEPASNLDIEHQIKLMEILKELALKGVGIIMTSHDIPLALTYSHEVLLIGNGKIIDSGSPGEISERDGLKRTVGVGAARIKNPGFLFDYSLIK